MAQPRYRPDHSDEFHARARKHFGLSQDEARHNFIPAPSPFTGPSEKPRSRRGNSETIICRYYLNLHLR